MKRWALALSLIALAVGISGCGGSAAANNATSNAGSGGTTTTANSTVINNVQSNTWLTCGNCGNTGATGATAPYSYALNIANPSEDNAATQFSLAATVPFTNGFFYQQHGAVKSQLNALTYEFDLYIPAGMENAPQAIEFQCQQTFDGYVYNFAWQADYASNQWRTFDYALTQWQSTGIALQRFAPGTWHHIVAEYHNDTTNHITFHDALTVDGVRMPVNITHNAPLTGGSSQFSNAVQLDSNSVPAAYSVYVDKMKITYQ